MNCPSHHNFCFQKPKPKKDKKDKKKKDKKKKKKKDKKKKDKKKKEKKKESDDYLACVEECFVDDEMCNSKCQSLDDCTSPMKKYIEKELVDYWSQVLDGGVDEWVSKLKEFIKEAPYGMMFHGQKDWCENLEKWIGDYDGTLGMGETIAVSFNVNVAKFSKIFISYSFHRFMRSSQEFSILEEIKCTKL